MNHLQVKNNTQAYFDTRNSLLQPMLIFSQCFLAGYVVFVQADIILDVNSPVEYLSNQYIYMCLRLLIILLFVFIFAYTTHKIKKPKQKPFLLLLLLAFFAPFLSELFLAKSLDCTSPTAKSLNLGDIDKPVTRDIPCANDFSKIIKYNLIPIVATFLALVIRIERFTLLKMIGVILSAMAAVVPIIWGLIIKAEYLTSFTLTDIYNFLQCTSAGIGLVVARILLSNYKLGVVNTIFWSYLIATIYAFIYLLVYIPDQDRLIQNLGFLKYLYKCLGIFYFLALLLLFRDMTITWCNKHAQVSKVSFYGSLQPICMTIFFMFFKDNSQVQIIHLVASGFALLGYILIFSEQEAIISRKRSEAERNKALKREHWFYMEDIGGYKSKARLYNRINVKDQFFYGNINESRIFSEQAVTEMGSLLLLEDGNEFGRQFTVEEGRSGSGYLGVRRSMGQNPQQFTPKMKRMSRAREMSADI